MDELCDDCPNCVLKRPEPDTADTAVLTALANIRHSAQLLENSAYALAGVRDSGFVATLMLLSKSCVDAADRIHDIGPEARKARL